MEDVIIDGSKDGTLEVDGRNEGIVDGDEDGILDIFAVGNKDGIIDGIEDGCKDGILEVVGRNEGISDVDAIFDGDDDIPQSESLLHNGCNVIVTLATPGVVVRSIDLTVIVRDLPELAKLSSV
mmetsp:Transcript_65017/g.96036  ORF Transcript_65017/g.96036 Transcript_65017/m.96036 type:complete len:124 (+) Transcript_65017:910-1281(+)